MRFYSQRDMMIRFYLDAFKKCSWSYHVTHLLSFELKAALNQSNFLFIWSSDHLNWSRWDNWIIILKSLRKEIWNSLQMLRCLHDWNSAASRDWKLEKSIFCASNFLDINDYSIFHKVLNLSLSFLHHSSRSDF
jgi:hypothetical protein